ncbi:MAG: hypothetical protein PUD34_01405 [bacterium]|nr:hypothetical protein [bacterium]
MKKYIIFIFSLFLGFTVVNAKAVQVTVDLDYNDDNVFNVFYEFKNDTSIARLITMYSGDMLDLFSEYDSEEFLTQLASGVSLFDHCSGNPSSYYIFIRKLEGKYYFNLVSYFTNKMYSIGFTPEGKFISATSGGKVSDSSTLNLQSVSTSNPYPLFSIFQGGREIFTNSAYTLTKVVNNGTTYTLSGVDLGVFANIGKFFGDMFKDKYEFSEDWSFDFSYYQKNLISSSSISIAPLKTTFFKFADTNLDGYSSVYVNETKDGIILAPIVNLDEMKSNGQDVSSYDIDFYIYTNRSSSNLYGNAMYLDKTVNDNGYSNLVNKDYSFATQLINPCNVQKFPLYNFNFGFEGYKYYEYVYHFYTTNTADEIILYYDPKVYSVVNYSSADSVTIDSFDGNHYIITSKTVKDSLTSIDSTTGGHISNGFNNNVSSSDISDIINEYSPAKILSSITVVLSSMFSFITLFLDFMPPYIKLPLVFFFNVGLCLYVLHLFK